MTSPVLRSGAVRAGGVQVVLFDTFGTVVDWRSGIAAAVEEMADGHSVAVDSAAFADAWRARYQPSMEPIRTGRRPFVRLTDLHRENLAATLKEFGWNVDPGEAEQLNQAWQRLPAWPDSVEGLLLLKRHYLIGPLSNGDTALLARMAKHAGLPWDVVIGADVTGQYKPHPDAYTRAAAILDLPPSAVMLVAAHNSDLAAARQAGLATGFIARPTEYGPGQSTDLDAEADWDVVATDLVDLSRQLTTDPDEIGRKPSDRGHATPAGSAGPARAVRQGDFQLPCDPATALPLFTPEGERHWVGGWHPEYLSGANDEVGAVWRTSHGEDITWITTDRDDDRVRYARVSSNGTAGFVEVLCTPTDGGTRVKVTYDLTACSAAGSDALHRFAAQFDGMLEHWRRATASVLARTPVTGHAGDHGARDR